MTFAALLLPCGCITTGHYAVPVSRLACLENFDSESGKVPIDLALLRQEPPAAYLLGPGDVLSVYIYGVLPPDIEQAPIVQPPINVGAEYYPPYGAIRVPSFGLPFQVDPSGQLALPLVPPIAVNGLTVDQAREKIRDAYERVEILKESRERIAVTLVRPRVNRVVVIREDVGAEIPIALIGTQAPYTLRGRGQVIDLPAFESDVLHALAATGGLPGIEARNEVWILRGAPNTDAAGRAALLGSDIDAALASLQVDSSVIRIPLRVHPGEAPCFGPADVVLHDGDVVFIPPRREFFYTGGLLPGGQIPLPRDRDLDVVEAIALAGGSTGGPSGGPGSLTFVGRGVGNIVPPTRVIILRRLPDGRQLPIRVDLCRAVRDARERVVIQPDDVVLLYYKSHELVASSILNFFGGTFVLAPNDF